ncbi:hypothetical protein Cni_G10978 [Canna indica]|uniref:Myb/SANT-like DNA-binding domain-containing protein n=1 Tax=Canna indica TaxID=4628 RepID=A0AAQ3K5R9_9LILI|nr:hypothetical protein Cni_G10978 [Canna indica]
MDGGNGGMLPTNMASGGLLGLDMSLHPHQQMHHQQQPQPLLHHQLQQTRQMLPFQTQTGGDGEHPIRHAQYMPLYGAAVRGKQPPTMSSEDEPGYGEEADDQARRTGEPSQPAPAAAASPWQRMKWTDSMVRLLIQVVYHVGDDGGGAEGEQQQQAHGSAAKGKKSGAASASPASVLLQKKGKWKSVSRAMMEKGFSVSPQQCEDKFNDLNKRYKRVNDLLGKGTACRVVENQALLETMDLSPKAKEEARKLLNSKHLFFREMCAYHHAGGSASCAAPTSQQMPLPPPPDQQQLCFHHPPGRADTAASTGKTAGGSRTVGAAAEEEGIAEEVDDDDDVDSVDDDDFDDEEDEDDIEEHNHRRHCHHHHHHPQHKHEEGEYDEDSKEFVAKKQKRASSQMSASPPLSLSLSSPSSSIQQLRSEMMVAMSGGGEHQQRQWLRRKSVELEEQRVTYQCRAFQLERQRFKWLRFSSNKEREMERMKLENERLRLENDRMLLLLRQREIELIHGGAAGGVPSASAASAEQHHMPNIDHPSTAA